MNGPRDFDALKCNRATKKRIALMLALWNQATEDGRTQIPQHMSGPESSSVRKRAQRAARQLGLTL